MELTGIERIGRQLKHQPVDRIGCMESFWSHTAAHWVDQGKLKPGEDPMRHFKLDLRTSWAFNLKIDHRKADELIAEDADTQTFLDGNGAKLRRHKAHASTPEHIGYAIADRADWEAKAKPFLTPDPARINLDAYIEARKQAAADNAFFCWGGVNVFEAIHPIAGHENMLMGMALDPDWVLEMADTYASLLIGLFEELFARGGKPDGIWFFEDMGFKGRPFMSPDMYKELIQGAHKRTIDFAHAHNLPVIMHSCGFVEPLLPGMIEAGIDCLQAIEVKAGMDVLKIHREYGNKIALMGGLDVRPVANNDLAGIRRELESKLPVLKQGNGFIFHSDHSIPESTDYDSYRYFLDTGLKLGTY